MKTTMNKGVKEERWSNQRLDSNRHNWCRKKGPECFNNLNQFNQGGEVPGQGNTDTVPAMLTPGEFVLN